MDKVFLLGGKDLEMYTIKDLLEENGQKFYDKGLSWNNARLSAYKEYILQCESKDTSFVGVELQADIELPLNYISIDHHNENSTKPSALEQVAVMLGIELNRFQQLVAANDRGYIDGMKDIGATDDEVWMIRQKDRICQGIKESEEIEASRLVSLLEKNVSPLMIETNLTHFSPIADRLYPMKDYVIYNYEEMVYYGSAKIERMKAAFADELADHKAYYGGSEPNQFFGILYNQSQLPNYKQIIIKLLAE